MRVAAIRPGGHDAPDERAIQMSPSILVAVLETNDVGGSPASRSSDSRHFYQH
jgi:hypothetical protein